MRISRIDCFFAGPDIEQITKHYNDPESFRIHSLVTYIPILTKMSTFHNSCPAIMWKIGKKDRTCQVAGAAFSLSVNISSQNQSDYGLFAVFFVTLCVLQDNFKQTVPEMFNHTRKVRRNQYLFMPP